ncbi:MAG TPA: trypsin-like peptidase domain-containing protein [Patescibacteria group bacterium]|nr:trypsin-like peptidase domain-containing protein [Patescibacteria group bacterium]
MRRVVLLLAIIIALFIGWGMVSNSALNWFQMPSVSLPGEQVKVVTEESVTVDTVKKVGPSVVTVVENLPPQQQQQIPFDLGPFGFFQTPPGGGQSQQPQAIGSGFIVNSNGLIVTSKHVVADTSGTYQVITANNKKYDVKQISRDPSNDIAFLKIDPSQNTGNPLPSVILGDSSHLQVGQFVIAIGTALGEFRNTVTTGVVSGLGRSITAGDQFQQTTEQLSNVIQTSAAINPGNSGGPLLNSSGQVIGVNTAVEQNGQNIGFALPVNLIKTSLQTFNQTGFARPYLGVSYSPISQAVALLNNVPEGVYVQNVVSGSPADKAGIQGGDIILSIDGSRVADQSDSLETVIAKKKIGQSIKITLWRNNKTMDVSAMLGNANNQ